MTIDRATAMRLGLTLSAIDNTLYDAFGQRQVSTIYNALNQYHVVMEVAPRYWQDPSTPAEHLGFDLRRQSHRNAVDQRERRAVRRLDRGGELGGDDRRRLGAQPGDEFARRQRPFQRLGRGGGLDFGRRRWFRCRRSRRSGRGQTPLERQSSGPVRGDDDFVQPRAGARAERSAEGDRGRGRQHPYAVDRARRVRRHRRDLPAIAIRRSCCCSARRWSPSTSCWAFSTRATSIPSRSFRRCRRRASAR